MYALVQPFQFPHWLFLIYQQTKTADRIVTHRGHQLLYCQDQLIGINMLWNQALNEKISLQPGIVRKANANLLTYLETELEGISLPSPIKPFSSGFIKGKVIQKEEHPDSDHLFVCQVNFGTYARQIVTNSTTVTVGSGVVVALEGALMKDGSMMETTMMLKQKTEGMFCSEKTLGLEPVTQPGVMLQTWKDEELGEDFYATGS
jgi:tRNA-binding protein